MDKVELKKIIKPLIKECIREVLMEQGLSKMISESITPAHVINNKPEENQQSKQLIENRKRMLEEIGKSGYVNSSFDPFSNTKALTESQASDGASSYGPLNGVDPNDPGVDISNLMNGNKNVWKALVGGKGK